MALIAVREHATTVNLAALYTYSVEGADLTERWRTCGASWRRSIRRWCCISRERSPT
jgi:hypothetical protein